MKNTLIIICFFFIIFFTNKSDEVYFNSINNYHIHTKNSYHNYIKYKNKKLNEKQIDRIVKSINNKEISASILLAIIEVESSFNPDAKSSTGAKGLMQINDKVWKMPISTIEDNIDAGIYILLKNKEYCNSIPLNAYGYHTTQECMIRKYFGVSSYPFTSANNSYYNKFRVALGEYVVFNSKM